MSPHSAPRPRRRSLLPLALLAALPAALLPGCDNPSCVFGGDCSQGGGGGGGGGLGTEGASFPENGAILSPAVPELVRVAPLGVNVHPETAIYIEFSESIDPSSLNGAIELVDLGFQQPVPTLQPVPTAANGRVAILLPAAELVGGRQYEVRYSQNANIVDLNGQTVNAGPGQRLTDFTISFEPSPVPSVLTTFPLDGERGASDVGEVVVVFDRPMDESSVDGSSFQVLVGGNPPAANPDAQPLTVQAGPIEVPVQQVYTWSSRADGEAISLGTNQDVQIDLSPASAPIFAAEQDGQALDPTSFSYELGPVAAPAAVFKEPIAPPADAIGGDNLANPTSPVVVVQLPTALGASDRLGVYIVGGSTLDPDVLRSLYREVTPSVTSASIQLGEAELDLLDEDGSPRLAEGTIDILVQVVRGNDITAVRRFDADLGSSEPQRPFFDVTPPTLLGLGLEGEDLASMVLATRDLTVVGRADEPVGFALLETADADNRFVLGQPPEVAGSTDEGLFVARPVRTGVLGAGGSETFTLTIYDRALNASEPLADVTYSQRGLVGGGGLVAAEPIAVRVLERDTLAPLQGALVMAQSWSDVGGYTELATLTSGADGSLTVPAAGAGLETVITVQLEGFDLFTVFGVPGSFLDVLLEPTSVEQAEAAGTITTSLATGAVLDQSTNLIGDSRLSVPGDPFLAVDDCTLDQATLGYRCSFGPSAIAPGRLGGQTLVSAEPTTSVLLAFALRYPIAPLSPAAVEEASIQVDSLLAAQEPEEGAIAVPPTTLTPPAGDGFGDVASLEVTVEGVATALDGTLPVGAGGGLETFGVYTVAGSYPGAADGILDDLADQTGRLVASGTLQGDLLFRIEFEDEAGNRGGIRPRLSSSTLDVQPMISTSPPALRSPAEGETTVGAAYTLEFDDVYPDILGVEGLYRVRLEDSTGRGWELWRQDGPGGGGGDTLSLELPPIAAQGGAPLAAGEIQASVAAFSWPELDLAGGRILWSDVLREFERFGFAAPVGFQQP